MEYHRFSDIWPLLEGAELDELALDIAAHGLVHPILTYQGKILDGRNRDRACKEAGVEPTYEVAQVTSDDEALDLVISLNKHRRHLSLEQQAFAAEKLANLILGSNRYEQRVDISTDIPTITKKMSLDAAAKKMEISPASVGRARAIRKHGTAEDVKAVLDGKASLLGKAKEVLNRNPSTAKRAKRGRRPAQSPDTPRVSPLDGLGPLKALSREQVDPEFTGTGMEYTAKYGHTVMHTAEERARLRFADWAAAMRVVAKGISNYPSWPLEVDLHWLRSPKARDVEKMSDAIDVLRAKLEAAEAMLARARAALATAKEPAKSEQPSAEGGI